MLNVLRKRFGHVSAERVLTGSGLVHLYETLAALDGRELASLTPGQVVESALQGGECRATLEMFCAMLGTVASNLALTLGAHGGVYVGGGVVPRFVDFFAQSGFRSRFEDKGRYRDYLARIPVYVIRTAMPAFIGLARALSDPAPSIVSEA